MSAAHRFFLRRRAPGQLADWPTGLGSQLWLEATANQDGARLGWAEVLCFCAGVGADEVLVSQGGTDSSGVTSQVPGLARGQTGIWRPESFLLHAWRCELPSLDLRKDCPHVGSCCRQRGFLLRLFLVDVPTKARGNHV